MGRCTARATGGRRECAARTKTTKNATTGSDRKAPRARNADWNNGEPIGQVCSEKLKDMDLHNRKLQRTLKW